MYNILYIEFFYQILTKKIFILQLKFKNMFNKKFFLVAAGYIAGNVIGSLYNKKTPSALQKELEESKQSGQGEVKVLLANFVETHKNVLADLENTIMSDKNKALFAEKKEQLLEIAEGYKIEGLKLLLEVQEKGKSHFVEVSDKLEKLYLEKKDELNELKEISPEKVKELKNNLLATFEELQSKIKESVQEVKGEAKQEVKKEAKSKLSKVKKMK